MNCEEKKQHTKSD